MVIRSWLIELYYRLTRRTVRSRPRRRRTFYSAVPVMVETMEPRIALTSFQGIGLQDQFNDFGSGSTPPDTMGAVGPNHFVEIINSSVAIYTKAGTRLSHVPLTTFFTDVGEGITPANGTFDPRVLYDQASGHWFATAMERGTVSGKDNDVILAVSDTSDPTGDWDRFRIDVGIATGANAFFTDYSTLGVDENGVYFGMTMFQDTGNDGTTNASFAKIAMTPKASLISGTPSLGTVTQVSNITDMYSSPQPATNFDDIAATDPFYFVSSSTTVFGNVNYRKVTWSGSTPTLSSTSVVTTSAYAAPINAPASGSTTNINVGDDRLQMALVRDGHLWTTRQVGLNSAGTSTSANRTGVEWIDLNVTGASPTLTQSGRIFDSAASDPRFYYYPSLTVTGQGHMRIGFSGSKSTEFAGAYSSGRLSSDGAGTTTAPVLIKAGEASYTRLDSSSRNRWGDYSFTSVDPNDDMTVWTIQEYAESNGTNVWGTWISSIAAPTPTLNNPGASASAGASNVTLNLTGTNFFDPGAGFPNHPGVQLTGGATNGITIDSVTFNSATSATVVFDIAAGASVGLRNIVLTNPDGQTVTVVGGFTVNGNTPPVANASSVTTDEDTAKTFAVSDFLFTDTEGNSLVSITVSGLSLASGDTLTVDQGSGPVAVTNGMTITAAQIATLIYTPAANANGVARSTFNFKVNDAGLGTVAATMTINVTAVNDVPVASASSVTTNEDTAKTFAISDFLFTDIEGNSLVSITVSGLALASGDTLTVDQGSGAVAVTNGMTITAAQIATLIYTPAANANGLARSTFTFKANDAGLGTVAATMSVNVTAVNDLPVAQASSVTTNEDTTKTFAVSDFLFTDIEGNSLVSITVSGLALASGDTLTVDQGSGAVAVTNGMTITAAQIATLIYTPAANANGSARSTFTFKANDAGLGTASATMSVNVTAVNDVPVLNNQSLPALAENSTNGTVVGTVAASDPDGGQTLTYAFTGGNTGGAFAINAANGQVTVANVAALDFEANPIFSLTVQVTDNGAPNLSTSGTVTVNLLNQFEVTASALQSIVPLYQYPLSAPNTLNDWWQRISVAATPDRPVTVIFNPNSGPFDPAVGGGDYANYLVGLSMLRSNPNVRILGYVATGFGATSQATILQQAGWYASGYKHNTTGASLIDGIFLDEMSNNVAHVAGYTAVANGIRALSGLAGHFITGNPGTTIPDDYLTAGTADLFIIREGTLADLLANATPSSVTAPAFNHLSFGAIVHSVSGGLGDLANALREFKLRGLDYGFVTDDSAPNEYDQAPTFFEAYLRDIHAPYTVPSTAASLPENSANGSVVLSVSAGDPDPGQTLTYAITGGNTGGAFAINASTGQVTVANSAALDFESVPTFVLTVQVTDNGTPALSDTATVTVNLTNVNEVPVALASSVTTNEDTAKTFAVSDFLFTDVEGNSLVSITVSALALASGDTLTVDQGSGAVAVTNGMTITAAQLATLIYTPVANTNGSARTTFSFKVNDGDSGTVAATMSVNVTAVNDVPVANASSVTTNEDTAKTFAVSDFLFSDVESNSLVSITVSGLALASGDTLTVDQGSGAVAVTNGMTITAAQIATLIYTPAANANGAARTTFSFKVNDADSGTVAATMSIHVTAVNDVPVALASSVTTNEDTAKTFAVSDFLFTDVESNSLVSITVSGLALASGDTLTVDQGSGPVAVTNGMTITAAQIAMLIYTPAANANGSARSTFSFKVNDADNGTVAATMTINVTAVNDVPVANASSVTMNEDTAKTFAVSDFLFSDVESNSLISITVSGLALASGDTLTVDQGSGAVAVTNGMTITAAQIATLIYMPAANANGSARSTFSFKVNDSGLGTVAATMTINVTAVNDVPVAQVSSVATNEDTPRTFGVPDFGFSDVEVDSLVSITVSNLNLASGDILTVNQGAGVVTVTNGMTITAAQLASLTYTPAANANGAIRSTFDFKVNDAGGNGTVAATMSIYVTAVNDVPVANTSSVTTNEDTAKTFAVSDFLFSDVEGNSLVSITVSGLALASGDTLTVDQGSGPVAVTNGMTITAAQIATLIYTAAANASGTARSTFNFKVDDAGLGTVAATMSVNVTAVNDVPVANASSVTTNEDTAKTFAVSDFLFSDVEGNSLVSITVSGLALAGGDTLTVDQGSGAVAVTNGMTITAAQIATLIYAPAANANGSARSTFSFKVNDSGLGTVAATMSVNLTAVNDLPVANTSSVTTNEDTAKTFAVSDFLFTDVEGNSLISITVSGLALASGDTLTVDQGSGAVAVTNGMTITAAQVPSLIYTPAANANGAARSTFSFKVNDAGLGTVAATMSVNVTAVNDVPVANASSVTTNEDTAKTFAVSDFLFVDVESNGLVSITVSGLSLASGDTLAVDQGSGAVAVTNGMTITAAQIATLIYTPGANANGAARTTFSFKVNDAGLGTVAATMSVNVTAVNDVPVANTSSVTTNEDTAKTFAVSDILFSDAEGNSLISITVSGLALASGDTLTVDQGSGPVTVTNGMTITAAQIASLIYAPAANANGSVRSTFSFKVNDAGLGTVAATMSVNVTAVNDVPVAQASSVATNEDTTKTFAVSDFLFNDVEGNSLVSITVSGLALASGDTLTVDQGSGAVAVTNGMTITAAQIATLIYTPAANANGAARSTFSFKVNDADSGTVAATMSVNVTAVNDVSEADASSVTTNEDTAKTFAASDFLFSDIEGNSLVSITVSGLALAGGDTLTVDQGSGPVAVTNGMTITAAQIATLIYTPAANANGAARSTFSFKVNDADLGTVAGTMTIHVTAIDDDPEVGAFDTTVTYTANGAAIMLDMNATVTDADTPRFNGGVLTVSLTANAEANDLLGIRQVTRLIGVSGSNVTYRGTIIGTLAGGVGTADLVITFNANAMISAVQTVLRNVTYRSVSATPSTAPRTVQITLTDGAGGISNLPTKSINVGAAPGVAPLAATLPATSVAVDQPSVTTVRLSSVHDSDFSMTFANTSTAGASSISNDQNAEDLLPFVNAEESERLKKRRRNL